jgi:hypothetical protein
MGSLVRLCAVLATLIVAGSFVLFAVDRMAEGSEAQRQSLSGSEGPAGSRSAIDVADPQPAVERVREATHSSAREVIDDADDLLLTPFAGVVDSDSVWVSRIVPGLLALLVYGLGGGLLANALPKPTSGAGDWRRSGA